MVFVYKAACAVKFFRGCSSGGVVGFGWWLCGVLGLFTTVRESGGRETEIKEKRYYFGKYILLCRYIILISRIGK